MSKKPEDSEYSRSGRAYMRYSGLAVQMGLLIGGGAWLGLWLDGKWQTDRIFTAVGSLLGLFIALYLLMREAR